MTNKERSIATEHPNVHTSPVPNTEVGKNIRPAVVGAVVPTVTVTDCAELPLICTVEVERPHVGAGDATGVITQERFTVPLNAASGAMLNAKLAL
jgi:hypothetical protein